jgi:predicted transcriptional regulator
VSTTTIRVTTHTRDLLNEVRLATGQSTDSVIEQALAALNEQRFWAAWAQAQAEGYEADLEQDLWDRASAADLRHPGES